jgi:hypothetical protein
VVVATKLNWLLFVQELEVKLGIVPTNVVTCDGVAHDPKPLDVKGVKPDAK